MTTLNTQNCRPALKRQTTSCPSTNYSEDIFEIVIEQSNVYACQCDTNKSLNLNAKELEESMGITVYMSLFGLPDRERCRVPECKGTKLLASTFNLIIRVIFSF